MQSLAPAKHLRLYIKVFMEKVYAFTMQINGEPVLYDVFFADEVYHFVPDDIQSNAPSFAFKLENNRWIAMQQTDPAVQLEATTCLDQYLFSQH